jgi:hypothetical protein
VEFGGAEHEGVGAVVGFGGDAVRVDDDASEGGNKAAPDGGIALHTPIRPRIRPATLRNLIAGKNDYTYRRDNPVEMVMQGSHFMPERPSIVENLVLDGGEFRRCGFSNSNRHIVPSLGRILQNSTIRGYTQAA